MASTSDARSIGQVLAGLKGDFPDISISKIRFLETEGLVSPLRAPSGYRRYTVRDIERLRYVLTVQRDQYLPLKVIREHLDLMDRGLAVPRRDGQPATSPSGAGPGSAGSGSAGSAGAAAVGPSGPGGLGAPGGPGGPGSGQAGGGSGARQALRLTRQELLDASGLTDSALAELERNHIVTPRRGTSAYGREALTLATAARRLSDFGIEGRHLRAFKMSADREIGLVEQAIAPYVRRAGVSRDVSGEVTQLVISFHAALIRSAMDH